MDLIKVRDCIEGLIKDIGDTRREIEAKGETKARAISDYDRSMAITLAVLRDSESYVLGDKRYKAPPVTIMEKIAKGICSEEAYKREVAESGYKACISNLNALLAQINAFQSIYRHMDETAYKK